MNKCFYAFLLCFFFLSLRLSAQVTLYSENFETGGATFSLNTTDLGCVGAAGYNQFIVNNAYTGGGGSLICFGFPFTYTINPTPTEPLGIFNSPTSSYMHTISDEAIADGILCSSYLAADGLCFFDEYNFTRMSADISTVGYTGVTLSFWWTCGGGPQSYGELYYSTNAGTGWTQVTTPLTQYNNQLSWTQTAVSLPVFDGQAQLRFGFRFVNATTATASDPGFSVDDMLITGNLAVAPSIVTDTIIPLAYCGGETILVPFTPTGAFVPGNIFTAELSDASGSFAAPVAIGSMAGIAFGTITATVPLGVTPGIGYRIRVVSSTPAVTGTDNGQDIELEPASEAGFISTVADSVCAGDSVLISIAGQYGFVIWESSTDGFNYFTETSGVNSFYFHPTAPTTLIRAVVQNAYCDADTSAALTITVSPAPVAAFSIADAGLMVTLTDLSTGGFIYAWLWDYGDGNTSTQQNPVYTYAAAGTYTICLTIQDSCGSDSTCIMLTDIEKLAPVSDQIRLYPNPFRDNLAMELNAGTSGKLTVKVFDLSGKVIIDISEQSIAKGKNVIMLQGGNQLAAGAYLVAMSLNGRQSYYKILKTI